MLALRKPLVHSLHEYCLQRVSFDLALYMMIALLRRQRLAPSPLVWLIQSSDMTCASSDSPHASMCQQYSPQIHAVLRRLLILISHCQGHNVSASSSSTSHHASYSFVNPSQSLLMLISSLVFFHVTSDPSSVFCVSFELSLILGSSIWQQFTVLNHAEAIQRRAQSLECIDDIES